MIFDFEPVHGAHQGQLGAAEVNLFLPRGLKPLFRPSLRGERPLDIDVFRQLRALGEDDDLVLADLDESPVDRDQLFAGSPA